MMEQPTSLLHVTAEVVREKEDVATMSLMTEYLEKYQIHPGDAPLGSSPESKLA